MLFKSVRTPCFEGITCCIVICLAYSYMEKPTFNDPPPPLSDTDENSSTEKELVEEKYAVLFLT